MSLLILPGVVDSLVLGWNFLTQVDTDSSRIWKVTTLKL